MGYPQGFCATTAPLGYHTIMVIDLTLRNHNWEGLLFVLPHMVPSNIMKLVLREEEFWSEPD